MHIRGFDTLRLERKHKKNAGNRIFTLPTTYHSRWTRNHKANKLFDNVPKKDITMEKCDLHDINGRKISKERVLTAFERNDGRIMKVVKELHIASINELNKFLQTNASIKELLDYFRNCLVNKAENIIYDVLDDDNDRLNLIKVAMFLLETLGRLIYSKQPAVNVLIENKLSNDEKKLKLALIFNISTPEITNDLNLLIENIDNGEDISTTINDDNNNIDKQLELIEKEDELKLMLDDIDNDNEIDIEVS